MPLYEHVFLARQDASSQQVDDLTNQFKAIVEGAGGKVAKTEYWGVKSLSYRMNKNRKAHFTLMNLDVPAAAITENCSRITGWTRGVPKPATSCTILARLTAACCFGGRPPCPASPSATTSTRTAVFSPTTIGITRSGK